MQIFAYHENAGGEGLFTRTGDAWAADPENGILAVADSPLRGLSLVKYDYPIGDHGYEAATTFCEGVVAAARLKLGSGNFDKAAMREVLVSANNDLLKLNQSLGKPYGDPLNYDLAETVGAAVVISGNKLVYGVLEDCYVNVLRGDELKEMSRDNFKYQIVKAARHIDRLSKEGTLEDTIPPEVKTILTPDRNWEPSWCSLQRNKPDAVNAEGEPVGWGCFTGEPEAEKFFQIDEVELQKGDHILVFSDGFIPMLENREFRKWFLENAKPTFAFQHEMRKKIMSEFGGKNKDNKEKTVLYVRF